MIFDILENSRRNLEKYNIETADDVRRQKNFIITFSDEMHHHIRELLRLFEKILLYTYQRRRMDMKSQRIVEELFEAF